MLVQAQLVEVDERRRRDLPLDALEARLVQLVRVSVFARDEAAHRVLEVFEHASAN
jgi:hypothetical protein